MNADANPIFGVLKKQFSVMLKDQLDEIQAAESTSKEMDDSPKKPEVKIKEKNLPSPADFERVVKVNGLYMLERRVIAMNERKNEEPTMSLAKSKKKKMKRRRMTGLADIHMNRNSF